MLGIPLAPTIADLTPLQVAFVHQIASSYTQDSDAGNNPRTTRTSLRGHAEARRAAREGSA